ncbi:hypothetical protein SFC50_25945 [Bacillus infantis]|uniref:hypothetical protein n=1 Tax=Bacillus infantis TaxID=324767 RepID=UPI0039824B33
MKWELATDEQLLTIMKEDKDCPKQSLQGVVMESLERGIFNKLIYWVFDNLVKDWRKTVRAWNIENEDILSMGYCGVLQALSRWKPGKSSFKSFAYMNIRSEFTHAMDQENAKKREINKHTESYDVPTESGESVLTFIRGSANVEKEVIRRLEYQNKMMLINEKEQQMIRLFMDGYRFQDIKKKIYKKKTTDGVREHFYEVLGKMGIVDFHIDVKKSQNSPKQKLNEQLVREIRQSTREFRTKQEEAEFYGLSRKLISKVRNYQIWKEVV